MYAGVFKMNRIPSRLLSDHVLENHPKRFGNRKVGVVFAEDLRLYKSSIESGKSSKFQRQSRRLFKKYRGKERKFNLRTSKVRRLFFVEELSLIQTSNN